MKVIVPGVMVRKESWLHYWIKREEKEIREMSVIISLAGFQ